LKKNAGPLLVGLIGLCAAAAFSAEEDRWRAGFSAGWRTIKDKTLESVYGGGWIFTPSLSYRISPGLWVGAEHETGYSKEARIGLFAEESRLAVRGTHIFLLYGRDKGRIRPFFKIGAGLFAFDMDIESPYVQANNFSSRDVSILFGGGLRVMLSRKFSAVAEAKYAALWADPFDDMVDLGGIRILGGLVFDF